MSALINKGMKIRVMLVCMGLMVAATLMCAQTAFAAFSFSSDVLGIGKIQSSSVLTTTIPAEEKLDITSVAVVAPADVLTAPTERVVTAPQVADVVQTVTASNNIESLSVSSEGVFVSAAGITINVSGDWDSALASTYGFSEEDGLYGGTASGVPVSETSMDIALPIQIARKLIPYGSQFELKYNDNTCIVTVTDCGGFAKYGRAFDLQPAVANALGFRGVGTVEYRYLG